MIKNSVIFLVVFSVVVFLSLHLIVTPYTLPLDPILDNTIAGYVPSDVIVYRERFVYGKIIIGIRFYDFIISCNVLPSSIVKCKIYNLQAQYRQIEFRIEQWENQAERPYLLREFTIKQYQ